MVLFLWPVEYEPWPGKGVVHQAGDVYWVVACSHCGHVQIPTYGSNECVYLSMWYSLTWEGCRQSLFLSSGPRSREWRPCMCTDLTSPPLAAGDRGPGASSKGQLRSRNPNLFGDASSPGPGQYFPLWGETRNNVRFADIFKRWFIFWRVGHSQLSEWCEYLRKTR